MTNLAIKIAPVLFAPVLLLGAAAAGIASLLPGGHAQPAASIHAVADIPPDYLSWYQQAAATQCDGLPWTILAAIGKVESDHGRSFAVGVHVGSNFAGARGPMQFLPATFQQYAEPTPAEGKSPPTPYDPPDAIWAAARMLCRNGAADGTNIRGAVFSYNHANWYVNKVLAQARDYGIAYLPVNPANATTIQKAVAFAQAQIGKPYQWAGNGDPGFDCSGLTHAAYAAAGILLPRTAQTQYDAGPHLSPLQPLQPGDLLFYGTPHHIHHVGLYIGLGLMIDAPDIGLRIRTDPVTARDFAGATRPTARR